MVRPLDRIGFHDRAAALPGEQIHRVRRVMPQQVVGPAARLAQRIHVAAAKEEGLHIHLLDLVLAVLDLAVHELMARIEAAGVAAHRHQAGLALQVDHCLRIPPAVGQRDLDLHMLAGLQALKRLRRMHLGRRAQDHGVHVLERQAGGEVGGDVADAVLLRHFLGLGQLAADQRHHLDTVDVLDAIEVLDAECAGAGQCDSDRHNGFSKIR